MRTPSVHLERPVVRFGMAMLAPCIQCVIHHQAAFEHFMVIGNVCERPSDSAYNPADCGVKSSREVSAPRTIAARCCSARSVKLYFFKNASKLHNSPSCVNSTPG